MAYLREGDMFEPSLPHIRNSRSGLMSDVNRRGMAPLDLDDSLLDDRARHVRFTSQGGPPSGYYNQTGQRDLCFYPRPPSPTGQGSRKQFLENQDQMRFYREEIAKKDTLISQLSSMDTPRMKGFDSSKIDELYASERIEGAATAKSELAGMSVKVSGLQAQLRELQSQLEVREDRIRELKLHVETSRANEAKHAAMSQSLKQTLIQYEAQHGSLEGAANRSGLAISSLQKENKDCQDRILELESRLRSHLEERERAEQDRSSIERRYSEITSKLSSLLYAEDVTGFKASSADTVFAKVSDVVQESSMLKGKLATMKEYVNTAETENKASRETIMRLVSEAEREHKSSSKYTHELETIRGERDSAVIRQREFDREMTVMTERLESTQRALAATKHELESREGHYSTVDREIRDHELQARNIDSQYCNFKEQIASLLTDNYHVVEPREEAIRERIKNMMLAVQDKSAHIDMLENKLSVVSQQMDGTGDVVRAAERRAKRAEADLAEFDERLHRAENEVAAGDVLRDGLRGDKDRYFRFLERITRILKMEPLAIDVGLDMATDAIMARAEQLIKHEGGDLVDRKTHIYNLQRKLKAYKEQLQSKDLHLDMLRKKLTGVEEQLLGRSDLEREKDGEFVKSRKLMKLVEKYKRELNETRLEVRDLKARLLESSDIRSRTLEQERELETLEAKVGQLEHVRQRQAHKITGLKEEVGVRSQELGDKREQAGNSIQALSSELRTTKTALSEISKRERQLLDLRQVLSRMLGLDVNTLAVPDYEIISRLEKLILANQSNATTAIVLDNAIEDMEDGFRSGYEDASRVLGTAARASRSPVRTRGTKPIHGRTRTRSLSPTRRRDTRAY